MKAVTGKVGATAGLILLLFAVNVSASAALPEIVPTPTAEKPLTFTSTLTHVFHLTPFVSFECTGGSNEGSFTSIDAGKSTLTLKGCITKSFFSKGLLCKTGTETNGTLVFTFNTSLVTMLLEKMLSLGIVMQLPTPVFVNCETILTEVSGGVLGKVDGVKSGAKGITSATLNFNVKENKQELKDCELLTSVCLEGKKVKQFSLFERISAEEGFHEAAMELTENKITFGKEAAIFY
jgi:hypothetical protein